MGTYASHPNLAAKLPQTGQPMKGILGLLRSKTSVNKPGTRARTRLLSTAFAGQGSGRLHAGALGSPCRSGRQAATRQPGGKLLQALWVRGQVHGPPGQGRSPWERMENFFEFASVPSNRDLIPPRRIRQLHGGAAVGHHRGGSPFSPGVSNCAWQKPPWRHPRKMSLLDSGIRFRFAPR